MANNINRLPNQKATKLKSKFPLTLGWLNWALNNRPRRFIIPIKILARPYDDAKGRWRIGGGINVPVNVTFKANKSQAKEIKRLLIQKKIQVVLTSMDDNNAE